MHLRHLGNGSLNPASPPASGLLFGVACEGSGHSRAKIRCRAVQVMKQRTEFWGQRGEAGPSIMRTACCIGW